jgi:hypothetical protein
MALSETFLITLTATSASTFLVCLRWLYRSKCSRVSCCGLLIERDTHTEEELDMVNPPPSDSGKTSRPNSPRNQNIQRITL